MAFRVPSSLSFHPLCLLDCFLSYERENSTFTQPAFFFFFHLPCGNPLSTLSARTLATLSTRLRPFSTCIFIRCVNNYRNHKSWYTADADLYIVTAIDAPSLTDRLAGRPLSDLYVLSMTHGLRGTAVRVHRHMFYFIRRVRYILFFFLTMSFIEASNICGLNEA